ncbi:MAG: flagellar hook-associated protein FlgL [Cellvibrionaceae bacterium]
MRISTLHIYNLARNSMADANQAINKTQEQLSTGKRVLSAADDPVAATRIQQLNNNLALVEQYNKNIVIAENNLSLEESTLDSANNLLQRIEELAIQAGNTASLSTGDYAALASEVDSRLDELFNIVNTRNSNGDYIFSGFKSDSPAFTGDSVNGFRFAGDEGQMQIKIDNNTNIDVSDSGKSLFVDVPSGSNNVITSANPNNRSNPPVSISIGQVVDQSAYDDFYPEDIIIQFNEDTDIVPAGKNFTVTERSTGKIIEANHPYTAGEELIYNGVSIRISGNPASADSGAGLAGDQLFVDSTDTQDVLTTLMRLRDAMNAHDGSQESIDRIESVVASSITNLSSSQESISETVTKIGARNNTLESTKELHLDTELVSKEILSDIGDIDYAEAASRLSQQTLILQASQASFLRISELTLFSRL